MCCFPLNIIVGARDSKLSRTQFREVYEEIRVFYPSIVFTPIWLKTMGDMDQTTTLRTLEKTDFFTREIDQLQLQGGCRISIHSAKDLPDPLPKGLIIACLTKGVDSSDSLVLREGEDFFSLRAGAIIATSSLRREEMVRKLRQDLSFVDIRGAIDVRLQKLNTKEVDGVVVATAALIRLGLLSNINCIKLLGSTVPLQGRLAVVVREDDSEMRAMFSSLAS
ncbi:MAG: hydroxymethylbilane synthase [Chlamydiales bacterium]|nr:hydroxymethylbilane synthase [Chlamydiales bacterium]